MVSLGAHGVPVRLVRPNWLNVKNSFQNFFILLFQSPELERSADCSDGLRRAMLLWERRTRLPGSVHTITTLTTSDIKVSTAASASACEYFWWGLLQTVVLCAKWWVLNFPYQLIYLGRYILIRHRVHRKLSSIRKSYDVRARFWLGQKKLSPGK